MVVRHSINIKFPLQQIRFDTNTLSFSINNIKSRQPSILYFKLHYYDMRKNEIDTYVSPRWLITPSWNQKYETFEVSDETIDKCAYTMIELVSLNTGSENPLYFTECMLMKGVFTDYHKPSELLDSQVIKFNNNIYANLYNADDNYLQVIRPSKTNLRTDKLLRAETTVLAPHLNDEKSIDNPINLLLEFINQTEQTITIQK